MSRELFYVKKDSKFIGKDRLKQDSLVLTYGGTYFTNTKLTKDEVELAKASFGSDIEVTPIIYKTYEVKLTDINGIPRTLRVQIYDDDFTSSDLMRKLQDSEWVVSDDGSNMINMKHIVEVSSVREVKE